ncbi:MAG: dihydroorotate dehydrogenase electron transfer subunit [Thermodesulfovibrionales bacterium]
MSSAPSIAGQAGPGAPSSRKFKAEITENAKVAPGHHLLSFKPLTVAPEPEPGQFYMLGVGALHDPLLKRPFSLLRKNGLEHQILYRVRGRGTALMKGLEPGDIIEVVGPLGRPFPRHPKKSTPLIVAGGVAIAAVFRLAEALRALKPVILYGARSKRELLMLEELEALAGELRTSTEDGSHGRKGTVIDLFAGLPKGGYVLYACGPRGMLKAVAGVARRRDIPGYVSMEENMACGLGACLGCVVITKAGYKRVCKEGPVFRIEDIFWETIEGEALRDRPHNGRAFPVREGGVAAP